MNTATASAIVPSEPFLIVNPKSGNVFTGGGTFAAILGPEPSQTITSSALTGANPGIAAYDAQDGLVMTPDSSGNVGVFDAATLRARGFIHIEGLTLLNGWVGYGKTGYALVDGGYLESLPNPGVAQFDPVSLTEGETIYEISLTTGKIVKEAGLPGSPGGLALSPNGQMLYTAILTGTVSTATLPSPVLFIEE